jgi:uncharacterized protein YutE (UPF0331/DUF86 family)
VTFITDRLGHLQRQLDHLRRIRPRVRSAADLEADVGLHNEVMFGLFVICQQLIDIAAELSARHGQAVDSYRTAVRNLARDPGFPADLVAELERLPGFRNVLVHEYLDLDLARAVEALHRLEPVERFVRIVRDLEAGTE